MAEVAQGNLATLNRMNYSFAPDHGAAVVGMILSDAELRREWMVELEEMRMAMLAVRSKLADELRCNVILIILILLPIIGHVLAPWA